MNSLLLKKLIFMSLLAHKIRYSKRSTEFRPNFLILLSFDVFIDEPNFVTWRRAFRVCSCIVVSFLEFLGMQEAFFGRWSSVFSASFLAYLLILTRSKDWYLLCRILESENHSLARKTYGQGWHFFHYYEQI